MMFRIIPLFFILFLAICLRAYQMEALSTFRGDQAIELTGVANILKGKFTLIGIKTSNSEVHNGAIMYYLLAPLLFLFHYDPIAGGVLQTILQLLSIVIIYSIGSKFWNMRIGAIASFLFAGSSLLVLYSRQTLLAFYPLFFSTVLLALGLLLNSARRKYAPFILGIGLGISFQVHFSMLAVFFWALTLPFITVPKKFILTYYAELFLGILIGFSPFLLFEFRHQFFNTQMFLRLIKGMSQTPSSVSFSQPFFWVKVLSKFLFGGNTLLAVITGFLLTVFSIGSIKKGNKRNLICITQIVSTMIFTIFFVRTSNEHYMISAFPPAALLISEIIEKIFRSSYKITAKISAILFGAGYLFIQIPQLGYGNNHGYTMHAGWNILAVKKSVQIIEGNVKNRPYDVAMLIDAENQALPLRYFLNRTTYLPLSETEYDKAKVLYVVAEQNLDFTSVSLYEINAFGAYDIQNKWEVQNGIKLYELTKRKV